MKLLKVRSNPEHVAQNGQNGRDRVLRTYIWSAVPGPHGNRHKTNLCATFKGRYFSDLWL